MGPRKRRVLVVSQAPLIRRLVAGVYRADGHEAYEHVFNEEITADVVAPTGEREPYDLVVGDSRDDTTGAVDALARLKEHAPGVPVAMLVTDVDGTAAQRLRAKGALALAVPLASKLLKALLRGK